jgi:hypothetical protein
MTTPEGLADARERRVFATQCPEFVRVAVEIAAGLMEEQVGML